MLLRFEFRTFHLKDQCPTIVSLSPALSDYFLLQLYSRFLFLLKLVLVVTNVPVSTRYYLAGPLKYSFSSVRPVVTLFSSFYIFIIFF